KFRKIVFENFKTNYPLRNLINLQKKLARKLILEDKFKKLECIAGIDVSYYDNIGIGACAVLDYRSKKILEAKTVSKKVNFPYIPTYLAFRELPAIKEVISKLRKKPDILMIDGNGVLHPLGIGIASHAGVVLNIPTIGVAKTLLCGKVEKTRLRAGESTKIFYNSKLVGFCLKTVKDAKPIYISPGHKVSFETTLEIVKYLSVSRIPEPLRLADSISRKILKNMRC
ncbi:MAG: endonuclease V, partial [Candidatus Thermoplasmatota archaeon]